MGRRPALSPLFSRRGGAPERLIAHRGVTGSNKLPSHPIGPRGKRNSQNQGKEIVASLFLLNRFFFNLLRPFFAVSSWFIQFQLLKTLSRMEPDL